MINIQSIIDFVEKLKSKIKLLFWIAVILVNFMFPEPNK